MLLFVYVFIGVYSPFSVQEDLVKAYIRVQCFRKLNLVYFEYDIVMRSL